jgi:hypothetical protein
MHGACPELRLQAGSRIRFHIGKLVDGGLFARHSATTRGLASIRGQQIASRLRQDCGQLGRILERLTPQPLEDDPESLIAEIFGERWLANLVAEQEQDPVAQLLKRYVGNNSRRGSSFAGH